MKKRVLFIISDLGGGGAEKVLISVLKNLSSERYDITLLLIFNEGVYKEQLPEYVKLKWLFESYPLPKLYRKAIEHFRSLYSVLVGRKAKKLLKGEHFDTIISFLEGSAVAVHSEIMDKADRNVSWVHTDIESFHYTISYFKNTYHEAAAYSKMSEIVFVSNMARDAFSRMFKDVSVKKTVIYNPLLVDEIRKQSVVGKIDKKRFTIICVGRLIPVKRLDRFVDVVSELRHRGHDVEGWIVGEGNQHTELESYIHKRDMTDFITLWGFQANPMVYIKAADVFLMTSDAEGFSLVIGESQIIGTPVVSTAITGPIELLSDGSGVLCDRDVTKLADAVERFIVSPKLMDEYKKRMAECVERKFDLAEVVGRIESVI